MTKTQCLLCESKDDSSHFHKDAFRDYYCCDACGLVYVPSSYFLSLKEEKKRYDLHENSPEQEGYVTFLSQMFEPLEPLLKSNSIGLDFGSGPGPTLHTMFKNKGHHMSLYDPFYAPDISTLSSHYDFITMTEVIEHLHTPQDVLRTLWQCLNKDGYLGIMTKRPPQDFAKWRYIQDDTHVGFYGDKTFSWISKTLNAKVVFDNKNVIILRR